MEYITKNAFLYVMLTLLISPWANAAVNNGGFESGLHAWHIEGRAGIDYGRGYAFSGHNNAYVRNRSGWNAITQDISLKPSTRYEFTAMVRTSSNFSTGYFGIRNSHHQVVEEARFSGSIANYQKVSFRFHSGNVGGNHKLFLGLHAAYDQWVQLDEVTSSEIDPDDGNVSGEKWVTHCRNLISIGAWPNGSDRDGVRVKQEGDSHRNCKEGFYLSHDGNNKEYVYSSILAAFTADKTICIQFSASENIIDDMCLVNRVTLKSMN